MGVLEEVMQMKSSGMTDSQIISSLQQKGFSPKEITDALSQAEVKAAVTGGTENADSNAGGPAVQGMQESIMSQESPQGLQGTQQETYSYEAPAEAEYGMQQMQPEGYEGYGEGYEYAPAEAGIDTSTIIEISEQVFSEKIKKTESKLHELMEFKALISPKIENLSERLKRIENTIDKLQIAILDKIGSYGRDLETTKKELEMMQDSFSKIVNSVVDAVSEKTEKDKKSGHKKHK